MQFYKHGKTKAEIDHDVEKARESGMKFDTQREPEAPWKNQLRKLSEVLLDDPQFQPKL